MKLNYFLVLSPVLATNGTEYLISYSAVSSSNGTVWTSAVPTTTGTTTGTVSTTTATTVYAGNATTVSVATSSSPVPATSSTPAPIPALTYSITYSITTAVSTSTATATTTAPINALSQNDNGAGATDTLQNLIEAADVVMYSALTCTLVSLYPIYQKTSLHGFKLHLVLSLLFTSLLFVSQVLGLYMRYAATTINLTMAVTWIASWLSLWNRIYIVRMMDLLLTRFKLATALYVASFVFHLLAATPLYVWWSLVNSPMQLWLEIGGSAWVLSIFLFEVPCLLYLALSLYHSTRNNTWYNEVRLEEVTFDFRMLLGLTLGIVLVDVGGLVCLGYSFFGPSALSVSLGRIAAYALVFHYFFVSLFFIVVTRMSFQSTRTTVSRMHLAIVFAVLISIINALSPTGSIAIKIGVSIGITEEVPSTMSLIDEAQAIILRMDMLNNLNQSLIHPDAKLEPVYVNNEFSSTLAITNSLYLNSSNVVANAVVGSGYSAMTKLSALISSVSKIPQCCGSSTNAALSSKATYPYFFRTIPTDEAQAKAFVGYLLGQGWTTVATACSTDDYGAGLNDAFVSFARAANITVLTQQKVDIGAPGAQAQNAALNLQAANARIILFFGYETEFKAIIDQAALLGMFGKGYAWMGSDGVTSIIGGSNDPKYAGVLFTYPSERVSGPAADQFDAYWKANRTLMTSNPYYMQSGVNSTGVYGYFMAACVDALVLGMHRLLQDNPSFTVQDLVSGKLRDKFVIPDTFQFPNATTSTGSLSFDENGDRLGNFEIWNIKTDGVPALTAIYVSASQQTELVGTYVYPGGTASLPKAVILPSEVADFIDLKDTTGLLGASLFLVGMSTCIVTFGMYLHYRNSVVIRTSSFNVGVVMQLCIMAALFQLIVMIGNPVTNTAICAVDSMIIPLAFSLYYGCVYAKNLRLYQIFNPSISVYVKTDARVFAYGCVWMVPNLVVLIVWNAISSIAPVATTARFSMGVYYWTCASASSSTGSNIILVLFLYNGIILINNLYMAFITRTVDEKYSEAKLIAVSIYNMTIVMIFTLAILFTPSLSFRLKVTIKMITLFYICMFNLATTFTSTVYFAYKESLTTIKRHTSSTSKKGERPSVRELIKSKGSKSKNGKPKDGA
ncbi:hypothetical protein HDV03_001789 [Kappamyces sp. JEL0829]|nr:hypothetical protein HDV03_001789 [Kappamyces sp. JEL0829]